MLMPFAAKGGRVLRVYNCVVSEHDVRLVILAALICLVSSYSALRLFGRTRGEAGLSRLGWLFLTSLAAGVGTWATHFVAMLAFRPALPTAYEPALTLLSLFLAIGSMGLGFWAAASLGAALWRWVGGAVVGAGVGLMHYTGMEAFLVPGHLTWEGGYVIASLLLGVALTAIALGVTGKGRRLAIASTILTAAIAGLHFTGMAAVSITLDPAIFVPQRGMESGVLAIGVAAGALVILGVGTLSLLLDQRSRDAGEQRLRVLAEATIEGIVITENDVILDANKSFCDMIGLSREAACGMRFARDVLGPALQTHLERGSVDRLEGDLVRADGATVPVEIIARAFDRAAGVNRRVFAIRDLRQEKAAERRIRFLAEHDVLTGLANRATFNERLADALAHAFDQGTSVAVLCIDLDRFKEINDLFGHAAGDAVLVEAARRMRHALGPNDILARLGGDEFAIIQPGGLQPQGAVALAQRVMEAMRPDFEVAGHAVVIGASIGLSIGPEDGAEPDRLLANADTALYRAKSEGRSSFRCFEPEMDSELRERHALAAELRRAIAHNQLTLAYQPQYNIASSELVGFEALVRWHHPERGSIPPSVFVPIAEETGQILALGDWVLRKACRDAASWSRPVKIAVNLSPAQFQQPNLPEIVRGILQETGLPGSRLELEVTETVLIRDLPRAVSLLRRLKALGIRIAMDDFGTGYSSLATLQAFPFDKIKIDRSFVGQVETHPQAVAIVRAVLSLGRSLGMGVVAEGVETAGQAKFLAEEACDEAQGYLFSRPRPIEAFADVVGLPPSTSMLDRAAA